MLKHFLILSTVLLTISSCTNDFELNEPKVETPVLYALLNANEANHYVRLERAFADPKTSALELAKNPDSLYYKNAVVKLLKLSTSGNVLKEFTLSEIDGNLEGLVREDGVFATTPNILYKISNDVIDLQPNENYRIEVTIGEKVITAQTIIVDNANITGAKLNFKLGFKTTLKWRGGDNSIFHNASYVFYITEQTTTGIEHKKLVWKISKNNDRPKDSEKNFEVAVLGEEFYSFLAGTLTKDPSIKRYYDGTEVVIESGGENFYKYIKIGQANLGITSSGEIPFYTNLSIGRGVFSSRSTTIKSLSLEGDTYTEMQENPLTKDLNFQ